MSVRQKIRAILICADLCRENKQVELVIADTADPVTGNYPDGTHHVQLAQNASLATLQSMQKSIMRAMATKNLRNCKAVADRVSNTSAGTFHLVAVYR